MYCSPLLRVSWITSFSPSPLSFYEVTKAPTCMEVVCLHPVWCPLLHPQNLTPSCLGPCYSLSLLSSRLVPYQFLLSFLDLGLYITSARGFSPNPVDSSMPPHPVLLQLSRCYFILIISYLVFSTRLDIHKEQGKMSVNSNPSTVSHT